MASLGLRSSHVFSTFRQGLRPGHVLFKQSTTPTSFSTSHSRNISFLQHRLIPASPRSVLFSSFQQTRQASNSSQPPHNVLAHLEQVANSNASSASSQNAFYAALLRANLPSILVERYETGRYATNPACDAMYARALERMADRSSGSSTAAAAPAGSYNTQSGGLSQETLQAVSRAVAANSRGASMASISRGSNGSSGSNATGDRTSPVHVVIDESRRRHLYKIFRFLLTFAFGAYLIMIAISFFFETSSPLRKVGGSGSHEVKSEKQKARFADVKGCDEAKEELQEIVDFLKSPDKYNQLGGKLPKGVLMIGPPGTGKTLLARAVAGEAGVPFFYMSGSEFDEVYVGVGAKRVRELFSNAKSKAPAIVFIDEIDAIGGKRNERDAAYHMQTLNQMLTELDGFDQTSGVVFIAATNFPQMLDKALTRPGRFDRQVVVELPDARGRIDILDHYMKKMKVAGDVNSETIARGTPGFSGADLENLVNQAAVHASKIGNREVDMLDLEWAKDRILMGAEKKSMVQLDKDKLLTAYHEAGHTLVALYSKECTPLYKVTIMPRGHALGVTFRLPEMDKFSQTRQELESDIDVAMGGKLAEELIYGVRSVTSGCSSDLQQATNLAYRMVMSYGMSDRLGSIAFDSKLYQTLSTETKQAIEDEVRKFLDDGLERARAILNAKRKELDLLAHALVKYETLNAEEVNKVIRGESLPNRKQVSDPGAPLKLPAVIPDVTGGSGDDKPSGGIQEPASS